jgi:uncharacterized protein YdeI (YjbR/CyaY-like superfamily)
MAKLIRRSYTEVEPDSRAAWRRWLSENHHKKESVWLVIAKKNSGLSSLPVAEAVEEALCFGYIDSVANKVDEKRFKILMAPRNPRSAWSKINKNRVKKLIKTGLMADAGLQVINAAKKSGRWSALDKVEAMEFPPELKKQLNRKPKALKNFQAFPASSRKAIFHWISSAKRAETIDKRIKHVVRLAAKNLRPNQWTPPNKKVTGA